VSESRSFEAVPAGPHLPLEPDDIEAVWSRRFRAPGVVRRWLLPVLLFCATLFTTLFFGGLTEDPSGNWRDHLRAGVPFAIPLLAILLSHEFGHFFTARAHGVAASPPYFIPFPSLAGTLGAVIRMRGPLPTRKALVDIGASGPIAGFIVALPILVYGLKLSHLSPSAIPTGGLPPQTPLWWTLNWLHGQPVLGDSSLDVLQKGPSVLYLLIRHWIFGALPRGHDVVLHPTAFAAWFGLLVTALNLLPVGQLDGGHVLYALAGARARTVGRGILAVLLVLGLVAWVGWLIWALIGWRVVGTAHPPVTDPEEPLGATRVAVAWLTFILFVLTFMPVPLAQY
jgi:membrane-associated protease RseP (regulator of RpoE activity)